MELDLKNFDFSKKVFHHPEKLIEYRNTGRCFPSTLEIDLTNACNHKCSFCFYADSLNKKIVLGEQKKVPSAEPERLKLIIQEAKFLGVKGISFSGGGEPLAHPAFSEIISHCKKLNFDIGLITNGSLIPRHIEAITSSLQWIRVSMAGGNNESYKSVQGVDDYEKVISNLRLLSDQNPKKKLNIGIIMLVNEENHLSLLELVDHVKSLNIHYIQIAPDQYSNNYSFWTEFANSKYLEICKKELNANGIDLLSTTYVNKNNKLVNNQSIYCHAHFFQTVITAEGDLIYCKNARGEKQYIIGNIYEESLKSIWNKETLLQQEKKIRCDNCGLFCRCMALNQSIEDFINPSNDMSINFVT